MKVSMKFGSLTNATTPGGSGNGNSISQEGGGGAVNIESVEDFPESPDDGTIYLVQKQVLVLPVDAELTNEKFESVDHLPPDADDNVLFLIRKR